jgi:hypothetical protein
MKRLLYLAPFFLQACANIVPPTGGEIDKQAPIIKQSYPKHEEINFKGTTLWIEFDEWIQVSDATKITLSPKPTEEPEIKAIKNRLTIVFPTPLSDSTTYQLSLNNGITDLTERTAYQGTSIAFSTGSSLDSLSIQVAAYQVGLPGFQKGISYHLKKEGAEYKTTSTETQTTFNYLSPGPYTLIAFSDRNKNNEAGNKEFQDSLKFLLTKDTIITFNLQYQDTTQLKLRRTKYQKGIYTYEFNKGIRIPDSSFCTLNKNRTILTAFAGSQLTSVSDSTGHTLQLNLKDSFPDIVPIQSPLISVDEHTYNTITYKLEFNQPLKSIRVNQKERNNPGFTFYETIKIQSDSQLITLDSLTPLSFSKPIDSTLQIIRRDKPNAYGSVSGIIKTKGAIIQLVNPNQEVIRQAVAQPNFAFSGLTAGQYYLRYFIDYNNNGFADIYINESKESYTYIEEPITIRQNWDIENIKF